MYETLAKLATTVLAFLIFFWVAKRLFWTSIVKAIEDRQARIRGEFDRIDELQLRVDSLKSDYEQRIGNIEAEARTRMQEAINHGRLIADQISDQAHKDAEATLARNKQMISIEMDKARKELRQDVVRMTIEASEKIIRDRLDEPRQRQLVEKFVEELSRK
jgi:F-type H+-transporting ATPase subunit b